MAIKKTVPQPNGAVAEYWVISTVQAYRRGGSGQGYDLTVHGYVSQDASRDPEKTPAASKVVRVGVPTPELKNDEGNVIAAAVPFQDGLTLAQLYDLLKKTPDFDGATDA